MKILSLHFKNLNSLYGEWEVDFSNSEIASEGIFAITGPTGAGKTTIMDAICLALYGLTPRLGNITASSNEIMSRNTGECFAEVTFSTQAGKYRCSWSQHRAYKKPDRNLTDAKHEIADAETGKLLETKKSLVPNVVKDKTGMDFDQFTRSMMLAQGSFARFLQSNADERAPILEQITGTEIYCRISIKVYERHKEEELKLNDLKKSTEGIEILSPDQLKELENENNNLQKQEKEISTLYREIEKQIKWCTDIEALKKEIVQLEQETDDIKVKFAEFKPDHKKLNLALQAAELESDYSVLNSLKQQQKADQQKLEKEKEKLVEIEKKRTEVEASHKVFEESCKQAKAEYKMQEPLLKQVRALDLQIHEKNESLKKLQNGIDKNDKQIADKEKQLQAFARDIKKINRQLKDVVETIESNRHDEKLVSEFSAIKDLLGNLESLEKELEKQEKEVRQYKKQTSKAEKDLQNATKAAESAKEDFNKHQSVLETQKLELNKLLGERLLREYRAERDSLLRERAYIKQIQDLEDMRKNLEDDQPCPLCGSFDHPFARGNVPAVDETDKKIQNLEKIINKAEKLESEIESAEKENNELKNRLNQNEKLKAEAEHKAEICNKELLQGSQRLSDKIDKLDQNRKTAKDKLEAVSVSELPEKNFSEFIDSLEKRKIAWLENVAQKEKIEKEQSRLESELKSCQEVLSTLVKIQKEEKNAQAAGSNECNVLLKQRQELYQDKEPDTEQQKLENKIEKADKKLESVKNELNEINQQLAAINSSIKNLDNEIEQRKSSIEKSEAVFAQKLEQQGFSDQQSFIEARLDKAERNNLNNKFKELETLKTQNDARKKDRAIRLDELLEQKLTAESVENLNKEYDRLHAELHIVSRRAGAVKQKLDDNQSARDKLEVKADLIEKQQKELECWEKLYKLIGSADGKKYRKFAQSLTFEILVYNANQQLAKLSDRYLLLQNNDSPLELSVVDNYQAGEIRSTRNLSGGESFIVSLALALGLSQMSSQKVRVDSLFLDEGFGSLDEDSLESALATLANLHQEGKLIGVISHVTVLKDRIGMQISVVPEDGGHSRLSGPGCQRIQ